MKKVINLLLILVLSFMFVSKVNASSITWSYITEQIQDFFGESDMNVSISGNNVIISGSNIDVNINEDKDVTLKSYSAKFQYQNNVISFVASDKSGLNENEKIASAILDTSNILFIVDEVINSYYENSEFDFEDVFNKEELLKYGINLKYKEIGISEEETAFDISEFSIDLNTFESVVTTSNPSEDPDLGGSSDLDDDPIDDDSDLGDDPVDDDPISRDQNVEPVDTGDSTIYIIVSFLVLCVGLIIYKFKSLGDFNSL